MKKLLIFDLDGTLINSLTDLANSVNYALMQYGYPTHELDAYKYFVGNGITVLVERALPEEARYREEIDRVLAAFVSYYTIHKEDATRPYEGIMELLHALHEQGVLLAVASNKYHEATCEIVKHYFGDQLFDGVYGMRSDMEPKPAPDVIFRILDETGIAPQDALYLGDSDVDMITAKRAGVDSVGVSWGYRTKEELRAHGACFMADKPGDILNLLVPAI